MKRHPELLELSREHHTALSLVQRGRQAVASRDAAALENVAQELERRFRDDLEPHFQEEETGWLPSLAAGGQAVLVNRTLAEHADLRRLAAALTADPATTGLFCELLHAHVRFEERELFPALESYLPAAPLTAG